MIEQAQAMGAAIAEVSAKEIFKEHAAEFLKTVYDRHTDGTYVHALAKMRYVNAEFGLGLNITKKK